MKTASWRYLASTVGSVAAVGLFVTACGGRDDAAPAPSDDAASANVAQLASDAYIFGYPLVIMDVSREVMTAVPKPDAKKSPVNQFHHAEAFPDYTFTDVVSPNADTLYSFAWLDLKGEPLVLSVPAIERRYYVMQMMDGWTNVFSSPGSRTTGSGKGEFAIVGPNWQGQLPAGVERLQSPTNMVWLIGRTQTNGRADYAAVHAIQAQYKLAPLSAWGNAYAPPSDVPVAADIDLQTPPVQQVSKMDSATFFSRLNALMVDNPPLTADAAVMERFATIGIAPGKPFDLKSLDPAVAAAVEQGARDGLGRILADAKKPHGHAISGWSVLPDNTANFGTDYMWRAIVALVGLGANLPADAIYPHAMTDSSGEPLTGANRYVVRFPEGELPPVKGFWSITMYNAKQAFVQNPINRYAIGDRDALKKDKDGGVTIYVQHDSPGKERESNWLPAPADSFNLFMRLYWPDEAIVNGTWKMPPVEQVQ